MKDQLYKYTIVALPEEAARNQLNAIRTYLYQNGFRYSNSSPKNDVHITVAELSTAQSQLDNLKNDLSIILNEVDPFELSYDYITDKIHSPSEKYPDGSAWIALYFRNTQLKNLAQAVDSYLIDKRISLTKEYVTALDIDPNNDLYSQIADHMNLCNYARVDKAQEARQYVIDNAPKSFIIDTVALRDQVGEIQWKLMLS